MKQAFFVCGVLYGLFSSLPSSAQEMEPLINNEKTIIIYNFIFQNEFANDLEEITSNDRNIALKMLTSLSDCSCDMNFLEEVFRDKIFLSRDLKDIISTLFRWELVECDPEEYYEACRSSIQVKWKSAYEIRKILNYWPNE